MAFEVQQVHPEYHRHKKLWQQVKDQLDGEETVKAKGEMYLPFPVSLPTDTRDTAEFKNQYAIYLFGAHYVNYTQQAVEDLVSSVFSRDPIIDETFPEELDYLDLSDVARILTTNLVSYGHSLLLVDYPTVEGEVSRQREKEENIAAYYSIYQALDILDWEFTRIGGKRVLTMVKVREQHVNEDNEYVYRYRVLMIGESTANAFLRSQADKTIKDEQKAFVPEDQQTQPMRVIKDTYIIEVYDEDDTLISETRPSANGVSLKQIPAVFTGVISNDGTIDKSPIQGIANSNLKHYQNTAELQHSINYIGHPMLSISGAPSGFLDKMNEIDPQTGAKRRLTVGASNSLVIEGETGSAELLQISADLVHFKQLEQLEKSMGEQGYRLKSDKSGVESSKSLTIRNSGNTSKLAAITTQVERSIKTSIEFINMFMGTSVPLDFKFDLVKNYLQLEADPAMITTLDGLVNGGRVPDYILFDYLVDSSLIDEDVKYDDLRNDSEVLDLGMDFDDGAGGTTDGKEEDKKPDA